MRQGYLQKLTDQLDALNSKLQAIPPGARLGLIETVVIAYERQIAQELTALISKDEPEHEDSFKSFLSRRGHLANTRLGYTAIPDNEANRLLITIACGLSDGTALSALKLLMPTLRLESLTLASDYGLEGWDHHSENPVDLISQVERICQTHLLNERADSLFPVYCLANLAEWSPGQRVGRANYYYDPTQDSDSSGQLTESEYNRLQQHSEQARAVFAALQGWQVAASDQGNLYGQLTYLASQLYANSVHGMGQEERAGALGATAIHAFFDYYFQLSIEVRQGLPGALKLEIKLLLACVADYHHKVPVDAFERFHENGARVVIALIDTCLATRRARLLDAIRNNEEQLSRVVLSSAAQATQVEVAKESFKGRLEELRCALNQGTYKGADPLPLRVSLLEELHVVLQFENLEDVQAFCQGLSEAEIQGLYNDAPDLAKKMVTALGSLGNLVMLLHALPPHKIETVFRALLPERRVVDMLAQGNVGVLLVSFNHEKMQRLWGVLVNNQAFRLRAIDVAAISVHLTPEQCEIVFNATPEERWANIFGTANDVECIFSNVGPRIRGIIFNAIPEECWAGIIKRPEDIYHVLKCFTLEQRNIVAKRIPWDEIIKEARDARGALKYLTSAQRAIVFEAIPLTHWDKLIEKVVHVEEVFEYLTLMECEAVSKAITGACWARILITKSVNVASRLLFNLESEKCGIVVNAIPEECWVEIIKTTRDIRSIFIWLTPEQCKIVAKKIGWDKIIKTPWDVKGALEGLTDAERAIVFDVISPLCVGIIKMAFDVSSVFRYFTPEECRIVAEKISWDKIIERAENVNQALKGLAHDQRVIVFDAISPERCAKHIQWVYGVVRVFECLAPEQRGMVFEAIPRGDWAKMIEMPNDVSRALKYLTPEQCKIVANEISWDRIIRMAGSVSWALGNLEPAQCRVVASSIPGAQWIKIIKTADDACAALKDLSNEQRCAIISCVDDNKQSLFSVFFTPLYNHYAPLYSLRTVGVFSRSHKHSLKEAEGYVRAHPGSTTAKVLNALLPGNN